MGHQPADTLRISRIRASVVCAINGGKYGEESVKVDFGALHEVRKHTRGIAVTLLINWPRQSHTWTS